MLQRVKTFGQTSWFRIRSKGRCLWTQLSCIFGAHKAGNIVFQWLCNKKFVSFSFHDIPPENYFLCRIFWIWVYFHMFEISPLPQPLQRQLWITRSRARISIPLIDVCHSFLRTFYSDLKLGHGHLLILGLLNYFTVLCHVCRLCGVEWGMNVNS
jgi:hypothetical protein